MRDFETVNGAKARGGSIDGPGPVVVNGMVFINLGYPRNGETNGNKIWYDLPFMVGSGSRIPGVR